MRDYDLDLRYAYGSRGSTELIGGAIGLIGGPMTHRPCAEAPPCGAVT